VWIRQELLIDTILNQHYSSFRFEQNKKSCEAQKRPGPCLESDKDPKKQKSTVPEKESTQTNADGEKKRKREQDQTKLNEPEMKKLKPAPELNDLISVTSSETTLEELTDSDVSPEDRAELATTPEMKKREDKHKKKKRSKHKAKKSKHKRPNPKDKETSPKDKETRPKDKARKTDQRVPPCRRCSTGCGSGRCACYQNEVGCQESCGCTGCENGYGKKSVQLRKKQPPGSPALDRL